MTLSLCVYTIEMMYLVLALFDDVQCCRFDASERLDAAIIKSRDGDDWLAKKKISRTDIILSRAASLIAVCGVGSISFFVLRAQLNILTTEMCNRAPDASKKEVDQFFHINTNPPPQ